MFNLKDNTFVEIKDYFNDLLDNFIFKTGFRNEDLVWLIAENVKHELPVDNDIFKSGKLHETRNSYENLVVMTTYYPVLIFDRPVIYLKELKDDSITLININVIKNHL